jgi:L-ribulose-5-phosphate 3-epimerase
MEIFNRRSFVQLAGAAIATAVLPVVAQPNSARLHGASKSVIPRLGLVVKVMKGGTSEAAIKHVHDLGIPTCQIFYDELNLREVAPLMAALKKYGVEVTAVSEHNPGPRIFDFYDGPRTIGIVPPEYRRARVDALKLAADFAHACNVPSIHTHLGFIPEDPNDPTYAVAIATIKEVAQHCKDRGVMLLCETGEETPITMLRMIQDVGSGNVFVNLDTANLILYGKGNPVDAMDVFGHLVRGTHMKDGLFPTGPRVLGKEVAIGKGRVDFPTLFKRLKEVNYAQTITIEREIEGPQQTADILQSKLFLQKLIEANFG